MAARHSVLYAGHALHELLGAMTVAVTFYAELLAVLSHTPRAQSLLIAYAAESMTEIR